MQSLKSKPSDKKAEKSILFLGDSITEGYRLPFQSSYPFLIQKKLIEKNRLCRVINGGISGDTTENALQRFQQYNSEYDNLSCMVIQLGLNDIFHDIPFSLIERNIIKIIQIARERYTEIQIFLIEMKLMKYFPDLTKKQFEELYKNISRTENVTLLPFLMEGVMDNPDLTMDDGLHPNEEGMTAVAENVWNSLYPYLPEVS